MGALDRRRGTLARWSCAAAVLFAVGAVVGAGDAAAAAGAGAKAEAKPVAPARPPAAPAVRLPELPPAASKALKKATHLVVAVTGSWSAPEASLSLYVRSAKGWGRELGPFAASVGKTGLAWGRGLLPPPEPPARVKKEGDGAAPAGVFSLGSVMGYEPRPPKGLKLPYRSAGVRTECVDDPASPLYNRIAERPAKGEPRWKSSEKMRRDDDLYRLLALVDHNGLVGKSRPEPEGGSCIFLRGGLAAGKPTSGDTALNGAELLRLLLALPSLGRTLLVQLPRAEYEAAVTAWGLPPLTER